MRWLAGRLLLKVDSVHLMCTESLIIKWMPTFARENCILEISGDEVVQANNGFVQE